MNRCACLVVLATTLLSPILIQAQSDVLGTAGKILQIGVDSRALAMGEAFSAVTKDRSALYWNPAGLAHVQQYELGLMHNLWIGDINDTYISYAQPLYQGGLGLSINYFNFGEFAKFDIDPNGYPVPLAETFTPFTLVVSGGYGMELSNIGNVGASLKLFSENVDTFSSMTLLIDLGLQRRNLIDRLDAALVIQNLGLPLEGFSMPLNARLGFAYHLPYLINQKEDGFIVSLDGRVPLPVDDSFSVNIGAEYRYLQLVAARVGYKLSSINQLGSVAGLTAGIGLSFANYALDYSITPLGDLGLAHQLTLSANFEDKNAKKRLKKREMMKKQQKHRNLSKTQNAGNNDNLGGLMTSLTGVKLRQPILVLISAEKDPKNATRIKQATFDFKVNLEKKVKRWGLKITDAKGRLIRSFSGEGKPSSLVWYGDTKRGEKLNETIFSQYSLEVLLEDGSVETSKGEVATTTQEKGSQAKRKQLATIYFLENSAELTAQATKLLDQAAEDVNKQPYLKLMINGHTDGAAEANSAFLLSKKRIDRVVRYLTTTHKVSLKNITTRASGKKKPIASNQTEEGRKKNRRVEITIVYKK